MNYEYMGAAIRTMEAAWWELICAKLFGKKSVGRDGDCVVTTHHWRGKSYMTANKTEKTPMINALSYLCGAVCVAGGFLMMLFYILIWAAL